MPGVPSSCDTRPRLFSPARMRERDHVRDARRWRTATRHAEVATRRSPATDVPMMKPDAPAQRHQRGGAGELRVRRPSAVRAPPATGAAASRTRRSSAPTTNSTQTCGLGEQRVARAAASEQTASRDLGAQDHDATVDVVGERSAPEAEHDERASPRRGRAAPTTTNEPVSCCACSGIATKVNIEPRYVTTPAANSARKSRERAQRGDVEPPARRCCWSRVVAHEVGV